MEKLRRANSYSSYSRQFVGDHILGYDCYRLQAAFCRRINPAHGLCGRPDMDISCCCANVAVQGHGSRIGELTYHVLGGEGL